MSLSQHAADTVRPPQAAATTHLVRQVSTSNSAAESALFSGGRPGKYYVTFTALTVDCYVFFKKGTGSTSITTTLGWPIPAGQERGWWIESNRLDAIEYITASSAGTLKWYISSPLFEVPNFVSGT